MLSAYLRWVNNVENDAPVLDGIRQMEMLVAYLRRSTHPKTQKVVQKV